MHAPLSSDRKWTLNFETRKVTLLRRIPCKCGWRGCWYEDGEVAQRMFEQHAAWADGKVGPVPEKVSE